MHRFKQYLIFVLWQIQTVKKILTMAKLLLWTGRSRQKINKKLTFIFFIYALLNLTRRTVMHVLRNLFHELVDNKEKYLNKHAP